MDNRYTTSLLYHFTVQLNDSCWLVLCLHCYVAHLLTHHTRELAANDLSVFGGSSVFTIELSDVVPSGPQTPAEWLQDTLCSNCLFCLHWCYHLDKKQTNKHKTSCRIMKWQQHPGEEKRHWGKEPSKNRLFLIPKTYLRLTIRVTIFTVTVYVYMRISILILIGD